MSLSLAHAPKQGAWKAFPRVLPRPRQKEYDIGIAMAVRAVPVPFRTDQRLPPPTFSPFVPTPAKAPMFSKPLYIQVRRNEFQVRNLTTSRTQQKQATPEFSHPRMLVGNFTAAQACLTTLIAETRGLALFTPAVIHPLATLEGGLSQVEERLFQELARGAGASKVIVWVGAPLSDAEVLVKLRGA